MKRVFPGFFAIVLFFSFISCSKSGTAESQAAASAQRDWKEIYLEELLAAQEYASSVEWENYDWDSNYPFELYGAELIDLNFDGTPELILFNPGAGGSQGMRILTISGDGVQMIFNDWGNMGEFKLYRKRGSDDHFFAFESANGDMSGWKGAYYLTGADTKMDKSFARAARFTDFSEYHEIEYNEETYEITELGTTFTFGGREVNEEQYWRLQNNVFADYEEIPFMSTGMIWGSDGNGDSFSIKLLTKNELMPFLDAFDEEDGIGDSDYGAGDFYSDELIRHLLGNVELAAELVNEHGMDVLVTGETVEINGKVCELVILGTNHADQFVREIYYAVYNLEDIYSYDPIDDEWYLIYVFGAVG